MANKLFEYAVIYHPSSTKEQKERGEEAKSNIVVPLTSVLAKDIAAVQMLAARAIPEEYTDMLDRVEIAIRPF